jgi:hypothetical protein
MGRGRAGGRRRSHTANNARSRGRMFQLGSRCLANEGKKAYEIL